LSIHGQQAFISNARPGLILAMGGGPSRLVATAARGLLEQDMPFVRLFPTGLAFGAQPKAESTRDLLLATRKGAVDPFLACSFGTLMRRPHALDRANTSRPASPEGRDRLRGV
jgi:hypothetical protein